MLVVTLYTVIQELEQLFVKQSSLEVYFEWLDSVIEKRVSEVGTLICSMYMYM